MSTSPDSSEAAASSGPSSVSEKLAAKRFKPLKETEPSSLTYMPSASAYQKSFLHRDIVLQVATSLNSVVSASFDGHVTFWRRDAVLGLVPVHHVPGLGRVVHISVDPAGNFVCVLARMTHIFNIANYSFDRIATLKLSFEPFCAEWISSASQRHGALAITAEGSPTIRIYDVSNDAAPLLYTIENLFSNPVLLLKFNRVFDAAIAFDSSGVIEYFGSASDGYSFPKSVSWRNKAETNLTLFEQSNIIPLSVAVAPNGVHFAVLSDDRKVRVFHFASAKLLRVIDDSLEKSHVCQPCDDAEIGRRYVLETELECLLKNKEFGQNISGLRCANLIFDPSGDFLVYATMRGIRVVRWANGSSVRYIGNSEKDRFLQVSLCRGDDLLGEPAPALIATAYQRQRLFLFVNEKQAAQCSADERDVGKEESLIPVDIMPESSAKSIPQFRVSPTKSSAAKRSLSSSSSSSLLRQPASPEPIVSPIKMLRDLVSRMPAQMFSEIGPIVELLEKQAGESKKKIRTLESRLANLDCRCVVEALANHVAVKHNEWHDELADVLATVHDDRARCRGAIVCQTHVTTRDIRRRLLYPRQMLDHFHGCALFPEQGSISDKLKAALAANPTDTRKLKIFDICDFKIGWRSDEKDVVAKYSTMLHHFRCECVLFEQTASGDDEAYFNGLRDLVKSNDIKVMYDKYCRHVHRGCTTVLFSNADPHADRIKQICAVLPGEYKCEPVSK